jgi:hypothetical protein
MNATYTSLLIGYFLFTIIETLSAEVSLCCWNTELSNPTEYVLRTSCNGNEHISEVDSDWLDDLGSGQALRNVCD